MVVLLRKFVSAIELLFECRRPASTDLDPIETVQTRCELPSEDRIFTQLIFEAQKYQTKSTTRCRGHKMRPRWRVRRVSFWGTWRTADGQLVVTARTVRPANIFAHSPAHNRPSRAEDGRATHIRLGLWAWFCSSRVFLRGSSFSSRA